MCSGRISSSYSTSGTLVTNPVNKKSHEWEKDLEVLTTSVLIHGNLNCFIIVVLTYVCEVIYNYLISPSILSNFYYLLILFNWFYYIYIRNMFFYYFFRPALYLCLDILIETKDTITSIYLNF